MDPNTAGYQLNLYYRPVYPRAATRRQDQQLVMMGHLYINVISPHRCRVTTICGCVITP